MNTKGPGCMKYVIRKGSGSHSDQPKQGLTEWISLSVCCPQGRALLSRLQGLKARGIQLKISSGLSGNSTELETLARYSQLLPTVLCSSLCVCLCSNMIILSMCLNPLSCPLSFHLPLHVCFHGDPVYCDRSVVILYPPCDKFLFLAASCLILDLHPFSISRRWGPLFEHDSADQRPPPLLLLGGRPEAFLHRQWQHGLEIPRHGIKVAHL